MNPYLRYILVSNTFFVFADNLLIPLYALFVIKIGGGAELAGILFGLKFITNSITQFFISKTKDGAKLDEKLLKLNYLIRGGAWLILVFFQSITFLAIAQIIIGISEGIGTPAFETLVSDNLDNKKHLKEWGTWGLVCNSTIALASITSGFIITDYGFNILFLIMAVLALISFLVLNIQKKAPTFSL